MGDVVIISFVLFKRIGLQPFFGRYRFLFKRHMHRECHQFKEKGFFKSAYDFYAEIHHGGIAPLSSAAFRNHGY